MLIGADTDPKPSVVGQVQEPAGPFPLRNYFAGKNDLVADEGQHVGRSRDGELVSSLTRQKSTRYIGQLRQPDAFEETLEREVLAERHEMQLVVARQNGPAVVDHIDRVIGAEPAAARHRLRAPRRAPGAPRGGC